MLLHVVILIVSIVMLWIGAGFLVDAAGRIAVRFGVSELVIGLTVVAFGTSAPEFVVTIGASVKGLSDISVSNIVGSNIFNLGFILGGVALVRGIEASRKLVYRDGVFMIMVTLLLLYIFSDLVFTRIEGGVLFFLLVAYMAVLFVKKESLEETETAQESATWKDFVIFPASVAAVVIGGHFLVDSASAVARMMGVSDWVIGVTIVAAGTSAPEMATSLSAIIKGKHGISAGNLIGSDIFNILGVLGLAGLINPMEINPRGYGSLIMLTGMVVLVMFFLRTGWRLSRLEGAILVLIGLTRWIFDLMH